MKHTVKGSLFNVDVISSIKEVGKSAVYWLATLSCGHKRIIKTRANAKACPRRVWCNQCWLSNQQATNDKE